MTIYIDHDYMCFPHAEEGFRAVETDAFEGKCKAYIKGHRFIPAGESWTAPDGTVINGEAVFAWRNFSELEAVQQRYEESSEELQAAMEEIAIREAALNELGVRADD